MLHFLLRVSWLQIFISFYALSYLKLVIKQLSIKKN